MFLGQPIFPGESAVDQLVEIIKVLGSPTASDIACMNPDYSEYHFPNIVHANWANVFRSKTPADGIDLIANLLVYQPQKRLTAYEALAHPFFDELRQFGLVLPNGQPLPPLFDFTELEQKSMGPVIYQKLMPNHFMSTKSSLDDIA
ncbi:hypothetical protein RCL1_009129 [Eukaryota sp. TZLM3-RCL]